MSHRVIQWGTGNVGFHSLRHIVRHPDFELVGVHAHSPEKIGVDAARLCGLSEDTGVIATNDIKYCPPSHKHNSSLAGCHCYFEWLIIV